MTNRSCNFQLTSRKQHWSVSWTVTSICYHHQFYSEPCRQARAKPREKLTNRFYLSKIKTPSKAQSSNTDKTFALSANFIFFIGDIASNLQMKYSRLKQWKHWIPCLFTRRLQFSVDSRKVLREQPVRFGEDNEQSTYDSFLSERMKKQQSFTIKLVSNASMLTCPDATLAKIITLLPQSVAVHGTWEVGLVLSWRSLIENVTRTVQLST